MRQIGFRYRDCARSKSNFQSSITFVFFEKSNFDFIFDIKIKSVILRIFADFAHFRRQNFDFRMTPLIFSDQATIFRRLAVTGRAFYVISTNLHVSILRISIFGRFHWFSATQPLFFDAWQSHGLLFTSFQWFCTFPISEFSFSDDFIDFQRPTIVSSTLGNHTACFLRIFKDFAHFRSQNLDFRTRSLISSDPGNVFRLKLI